MRTPWILRRAVSSVAALAAALSCLVGVAPNVAARSSAAVGYVANEFPSGDMTIQPYGTVAGKCLRMALMSLDDGGTVEQAACVTGGPASSQRFHVIKKTEPEVMIRTFAGKCLDIANGSERTGASVVQFPCDDNSKSQRFRLLRVWNNVFVVKTSAPGQCLEVLEGSADDGTEVRQQTCRSEEDLKGQRMKFDKVTAGGGSPADPLAL
ncbi:RICIN domain-containing protein [Streptomyces sp. NPDC046261]|uniref:RICIN domain-containing protein n=1 Tax=Streptomyces sp. NPDC046261 TaxID=3157200 RepID=UPI0033EF3E5A